jgi:hypothetical protein
MDGPTAGGGVGFGGGRLTGVVGAFVCLIVAGVDGFGVPGLSEAGGPSLSAADVSGA